MFHHPDQDSQNPQPLGGKLILPAPPEEAQQAYPPTIAAWPAQPHSSLPPDPTQYAYPRQTPLPPDPAYYTYPQNALQQPRGRRRKDPAYLVLSLAIALVVVATLVFVAYGATTLLNNGATSPTASGGHPNPGAPTAGQGAVSHPLCLRPSCNPHPPQWTRGR